MQSVAKICPAVIYAVSYTHLDVYKRQPCAASAYNSAMNADIPTVYTAVSDPVVAGLAKEDGSSVGNITGSSVSYTHLDVYKRQNMETMESI